MSRVLIITGMHRSGTSLVAGLLARAGVHLGARLLAPRADNPFGYFEDEDFFQFHKDALYARGQNILVTRDFQFVPTAAEVRRAQELIAARASHELWGWKDPRTCLCLEFWREQLPQADFLLLYRHPWDVLLSLMRRSDRALMGLLEGIEAWYAYNAALAAFQARYPEQTLLCHSYAVVDQIGSFNMLLRERLGLDLELSTAELDAQYHPGELHRIMRSHATERILENIHPDAMALYAHLDSAAALPAPSLPAAETTLSERLLMALAAETEPEAVGMRRGLLFALLGVTQPEALESFVHGHAEAIRQMERDLEYFVRERAAWEETARAREQILCAQQAWAQERITHLQKVEAHPVVRALKRMNQIP